MASQNFNISAKRGKLYLKSKEPRDGYEAVPYGDGKITYHKYVNSVQGVITKVETKEVNVQTGKLQFFDVTLKDGDTYNNVSVTLKNSRGNFTDEVKALVSSLNNCPPFARVIMSVNSNTTEKDGKTYDNINVYINLLDEIDPKSNKPKSTGFIPFSEIPRAIKDDDPDLGVSYDWKPVNKYYIGKINEITAKFNAAKNEVPTSISAPESINEPATILEDDLPF